MNKLFKRARPLLGTLVEISLWNSCDSHANYAITKAFQEIENVQSVLSIHAPDSEVSKLNALKKGIPFKIQNLTAEIIKIAKAIFNSAEGFFDITFAKEKHSRVSMKDIRFLDDETLVFDRDLKLDFGGIGKGFAVDKAISCLQSLEIKNALVSAGGDLRAVGAVKQSVYLRNPSNPREVFKTFEIQEQAIATSANYYRNEGSGCDFDRGIINPKTNEVWKSNCSISVSAPDCARADALSKVVALRGKNAKKALELNSAQAFYSSGLEILAL